LFTPPEYAAADSIVAAGIGAEGIASGTVTETTLGEAAESPVTLTDAFAASSAQRLNADMKKTANANLAPILVLNLILASRTARRDHQKPERRVNSTRIEQAKHGNAKSG
jgi:hypothetical protein